MGSKFTALPVGQGDAFLLERGERAILVDGGRARHAFTSTIAAHSKTQRLSIVVCTHADADHAEGLIGLLEGNTIQVEEVWLPGRWTERLADLCRDPEAFVTAAIHQAHEADVSSLETFGQALAEQASCAGLDRTQGVSDEERTLESQASNPPEDPAPDVTAALGHRSV